jgi:hypothetical protein
LELFSLEEEATQLPGGLFVLLFPPRCEGKSTQRSARKVDLLKLAREAVGTLPDFQRIIR